MNIASRILVTAGAISMLTQMVHAGPLQTKIGRAVQWVVEGMVYTNDPFFGGEPDARDVSEEGMVYTNDPFFGGEPDARDVSVKQLQSGDYDVGRTRDRHPIPGSFRTSWHLPPADLTSQPANLSCSR